MDEDEKKVAKPGSAARVRIPSLPLSKRQTKPKSFAVGTSPLPEPHLPPIEEERVRLDSANLQQIDRALAESTTEGDAPPKRKRGLSIFDEIEQREKPLTKPAAAAPLPVQPLPPVLPSETEAEVIEINAPFAVTEETPIPRIESDPTHGLGRRLGHYELIRSIGTGGMAEVFLARRDGLMGFEKQVAVKCIHPHLVKEEHFVSMFFDEARLAARISDPRVVQIYELGEANGTYFIAMEYLAGENLNTLLRRGLKGGPALPPHYAARIVADVCGGLHAAHELRDEHGLLLDVVHRDMSHGNIVILYSGAIKVLDFGVAKARNSLTKTVAGERKGKFGYMSPEQIRGEALDRRSDIFSLGVVLWETLTRKRLFAAETEPATMKRVLEGEPPPPSTMVPGISAQLDAIVLRALAKDRADRFQTCEEMATVIEHYLHHAGLPASNNDVGAYMRNAFADRIAAKSSPGRDRIDHREGEPLPLVDMRSSDPRPLTPTHVTRPPSGSKRAMVIVAAILAPALIVGAFAIGRKGSDNGSAAKDVAAPIVAAHVDAGPTTPVTTPDKSLVDSKLDGAEIAIRNGRMASPPGDNALEMIIDGEAIDPTSTRAKALRATAVEKMLADAAVLWDAGKQDSARNVYDDVLLFDPQNEIATVRRVSREPRIAPKTAAEVAIANPDEIPWLVSQIDLAIIERRLIEPPGRNALEYLQRLRKIDPKNTVGHRLSSEVEKALAVAANGKTAEQKAKLLAAAKEAHDDDGKSGSGAAPEKTRDAKLAAEWIDKGNTQLGSGHLAEARRAFEKAIVADSGAHGALAGLAEVAYNESDYTRAVLAAKRAVSLAPGATAYRMSLAKSYYKLLRYDDAIVQWKKVIELAPKSSSAGSAQKNIDMAQRKMGGGG